MIHASGYGFVFTYLEAAKGDIIDTDHHEQPIGIHGRDILFPPLLQVLDGVSRYAVVHDFNAEFRITGCQEEVREKNISGSQGRIGLLLAGRDTIPDE
jgi:hypothetical protein